MADKIFQAVVESPVKVGNRRRYVVPVSVLVHTLLVATVFVVSLETGDALPVPPTMMAFFTTVTPTPPPPPPPAPRSDPARRPAPSPSAADINAAPLEAPTTIAPETELEAVRNDAGVVEGTRNGLPDGIFEGHSGPLPPPPPPPPPVKPVQVGGDVKPPVKIKDVRPSYPPLAQAAHVQGIVIIQTVISPTGKVIDATVLRSVPMLDAAALDAVRQWEYTPTRLNGLPVSVVMTVTVTFKLQ
jgi:protein TonB